MNQSLEHRKKWVSEQQKVRKWDSLVPSIFHFSPTIQRSILRFSPDVSKFLLVCE